MIASIAWGLEAVLTAVAFFPFFRRRIAVIYWWLAFRVWGDFACFIAWDFFGYKAYVWADYISRNIQYALIALVSVYTVSQVLREHPKTRTAYMGLLGAMAVCSVLLFHAGIPSAQAVLKFEIWAEITLSGFVAMAMGTANGKAPRPWGTISLALVTLGSSDLLVTALRLRGWHAEPFYPIGEIAGLAILALAGWRNYALAEVRLPLGMKKPPTSVRLQPLESRMVH